MVGSRRSRQNDIATDIDTDNAADERKAGPQLFGFRAVYVFDISQTEGKGLPTLTEVQGDVSGYRERLFDFVHSQGVELNYSERIAPAKGLSHGGKITLLSGMKPAEEFSTLIHEIAHEMLHRGDRRTLTTKKAKPRPKQLPLWLAKQLVLKRAPRVPITSSYGMEMRISCERVWKPFSRPQPYSSEPLPPSPNRRRNPTLATRSRNPSRIALFHR
jgi:hypothetical protein